MADYSQAFGDFGGAVTDLFASAGSAKAGAAYGQAATIAQQNEAITKRSTDIQLQQENITIGQATGAEAAQTAGAGFQTNSGSAGDLMRASLQQGALSKQLIANQGEITAQGFEQEAQAYKGQQQSAQLQSKGQGAGGILSAVAGIASLFSDPRLKRDIMLVGFMGPYNIYRFRYLGDDTFYEGIMADEVLEIMPRAVTEIDGFLAVNYDMIGVEMKRVANA